MATQQVHGKFKLFVGPVAADGSIGTIADDLAAFVKTTGVAAKSIGVEYLESARKLIVSLGYRDDEPSYGVRVSTVSLGKLGALETGDVARLEAAMLKATATQAGIICHELFVTESGDCQMVLMSRA